MESAEKYLVYIQKRFSGHLFFFFDDWATAHEFALGARSEPDEDELWGYVNEWRWTQPMLVTFSNQETHNLLSKDNIDASLIEFTLYKVRVMATATIDYDHPNNNDEIPWLMKLAPRENESSMVEGLLQTFPNMTLYIN